MEQGVAAGGREGWREGGREGGPGSRSGGGGRGIPRLELQKSDVYATGIGPDTTDVYLASTLLGEKKKLGGGKGGAKYLSSYY